MICSRIVDEYHIVEKNNRYIVDTNVLIYLYGDSALRTETEKLKLMSRKYNAALDLGCKVYVPAIVISEFVNKWHRLQFKNIKFLKGRKNLDYKKDYRNTKKYIENNEFIIKTINESILSRCIMIDDGFKEEEKTKIFGINEGQDFNDVLIINIANNNKCYLLSADIDAKKIVIN